MRLIVFFVSVTLWEKICCDLSDLYILEEALWGAVLILQFNTEDYKIIHMELCKQKRCKLSKIGFIF